MQPAPQRTLSLADAVTTILSIILGAGIFVAPASLARVAATPAEAAAWWVGGGMVALCGALCYAECGARLPRDGGFFIFYERVFGATAARLCGWAALLITYPASIAGVALVGAQYLLQLGGWASDRLLTATATATATAGILSLGALCNTFGVRLGAWVQRALTFVKAGIILVVCTAALCTAPSGDVATAAAAIESPPSLSGLVAAFAVCMWTLDGWTDVTMLGGELEDPQRNLGRAVALALAGIVALYALVQVCVMRILGSARAAASHSVLADAVATRLGPGAATLVAVLVVLSCVGAVVSLFLTTSRLAYAMARQGALPRQFAALHPRHQTPLRGLWGVWLLALVFAAGGGFEALVRYFSSIIWLFYALTAVALLRLRRAGVGGPRVWRAPLGILPPAVTLLTACIMTGTLLRAQPWQCVGSALLLTTLLGLDRWQRSRAVPLQV